MRIFVEVSNNLGRVLAHRTVQYCMRYGCESCTKCICVNCDAFRRFDSTTRSIWTEGPHRSREHAQLVQGWRTARSSADSTLLHRDYRKTMTRGSAPPCEIDVRLARSRTHVCRGTFGNAPRQTAIAAMRQPTIKFKEVRFRGSVDILNRYGDRQIGWRVELIQQPQRHKVRSQIMPHPIHLSGVWRLKHQLRNVAGQTFHHALFTRRNVGTSMKPLASRERSVCSMPIPR